VISTLFNVGVFVLGTPTSPRVLVRHADLLTAYADASLQNEREAYLSHFIFGAEMQAHYVANRQSVAGFAGPCWCRWLVLDIDRADLADALADARRLVTALYHRYPETVGDVPVYFSGNKGFHVLVELAHNPPPAVGFHRVARTFAELLAARAGVKIDTSVYDIAHIIRLPNTRHPKTGLFKRFIASEALFRMTAERIRDHARYPASDGIPAVRSCPEQLAADWYEAQAATAHAAQARAQQQGDFRPDARAPRYFLDLLRFGVKEGQRHTTLFRCAAWLTEQGAPPSLCHALLTEAGCDVGLSPKDVERQIRCGITHAQRQRAAADPRPNSTDDDEADERGGLQHDSDSLPPGAMGFPFGALALRESEGGPA
jgi:hypothetical protein